MNFVLKKIRNLYGFTNLFISFPYLILIAATTEVVTGVENLQKSGPSTGCNNYPDFGQFIPKNYFKAYCSAAPYAWAEEKYWYDDYRDVPWDVFMPCQALIALRRRGSVK